MKNVLIRAIIFFTMILSFSSAVNGSDKNNENEIITYRQIQSPAICINQINGDELIINDTLFRKTEGTLYYNLDGKRVGSTSFRVGTCVKIISDKGNMVLALYEAVKEERRDNPDAVSSAYVDSIKQAGSLQNRPVENVVPEVKKKEIIKNEGGVWKN